MFRTDHRLIDDYHWIRRRLRTIVWMQWKRGRARFAILTSRQRDVMILVSQGLSNKQVAERLNITEGTVKVHLHRIYSRTGLQNRTALSSFAMRQMLFRSASLLLLCLAGDAFLAITAYGVVTLLAG